MPLEVDAIETDRLLLRPPIEADLDGWASCMADERVARFIGGVQCRSQAWRSLATVAGSWALRGYGLFSVIERASGRWIGRLGPWQPEGWPGTEIGWILIQAAWGRGYATEGAAAAIDWAVDRLGWSDIIHCIDAENIASAAVAARLGSSERGAGRYPPPFDRNQTRIWGQSAAQWRQRRAEMAARQPRC